MINLAGLTWEKHDNEFLSHANYEEAVLDDYFQDLVDVFVDLHITLRKYPKRYFIAYEADFDGRYPEYCDTPVTIWGTPAHAEFEADPDKYLNELRSHLESLMVSGDENG